MASPRVDKLVKGNLVFHEHEVSDINGLVTNLVDTKANILAHAATSGLLAFSTDTYEAWMADGSTWRKQPFSLVPDTSLWDAGFTQESSRIGYGVDYVHQKVVANCLIGSNTRAETGAIRVSNGYFQIYVNGQWNDVVINFRFREDSSENYAMEHQPIASGDWYNLANGNSDRVGLNGLPLFIGYKGTAGAYPLAPIVGGDTF